MTLSFELFSQKVIFRCVTGSVFASEYNNSNVSYKQRKSFMNAFWNSVSYYLDKIVPVQSPQ